MHVDRDAHVEKVVKLQTNAMSLTIISEDKYFTGAHLLILLMHVCTLKYNRAITWSFVPNKMKSITIGALTDYMKASQASQ